MFATPFEIILSVSLLQNICATPFSNVSRHEVPFFSNLLAFVCSIIFSYLLITFVYSSSHSLLALLQFALNLFTSFIPYGFFLYSMVSKLLSKLESVTVTHPLFGNIIYMTLLYKLFSNQFVTPQF